MIKKQKFLGLIIMVISFTFIFAHLPTSEAHILVIADANNYNEVKSIATSLKSKGYPVLELYKENATAKRIVKGMYNADAIIYAGHGGYQSGNYVTGGTAKPPFALVGYDAFIWGIGDKMRIGWSGYMFKAPVKKNIPVILLHTCLSTGYVGSTEVKNPTETIYYFSKMFRGASANYYATSWNGGEIIYDFLNGATSFADANQKNYEVIRKSTTYNGTLIYRNDQGHAAFVGNWSAKFPSVSQTTRYNDSAAESWYRIYVQYIRPDLTVTNAYKSGGYLYITIKNQGKATSGACYTRAYYGNYYKNIYTYGLTPGASRTYKVSFTYAHGTVKTDYQSKILELSESNNIRTF